VRPEKHRKDRPVYYAYLLRLRWVENAGRPVWRISLEAPGSQDPVRFDSLAAMCAYLAEQLGPDQAADQGEQGLE
jgi:hypothetical protein